MAEETENPARNIPLGILIALITAGLIYMLISFLSVWIISPEELAASEAPLLAVVQRAFPFFPPVIFTVISVFAVVNTALLNYVTASRLLYGMGKEKMVPAIFGNIHPKRLTPSIAILSILPVVLLIAWTGATQYLAGTTATLMLVIFIVANLALLKIRWTESATSSRLKLNWKDLFPILAILINSILIAFGSTESHRLALILAGAGVLIIGLQKLRGSRSAKKKRKK